MYELSDHALWTYTREYFEHFAQNILHHCDSGTHSREGADARTVALGMLATACRLNPELSELGERAVVAADQRDEETLDLILSKMETMIAEMV